MIYGIINENKGKINEKKLKNLKEELASRIIVALIFVLSIIGYYMQKELGYFIFLATVFVIVFRTLINWFSKFSRNN